MTPQEWLCAQLTTILTNNNPNADPGGIAQLANELSGMWSNLILPNLQVDLITGDVTFNVPSS